ncbi:MAG: lumenal Hsp70 protein [Icmadophila ericetorum]|nr:lumenal Hsp70 protein [Icmadophila ericetorum]
MPPYGRRCTAALYTIFAIFCLCVSSASAASAVLGIDLGTEYIKAALVKPGIPLEIVLTKDSKRKEAAAVAFKPQKSKSTKPDSDVFPERAYGGDALALSARFPSDVYSNLKPLLGLTYQTNPVVEQYRNVHPGLHIMEKKERGTVAFNSESFGATEEPFMVEELLAMELQNIKANAQAFAGKGSTIKDVVFTIPAFYTVEEKRALQLAADLAGLNTLAMMSDGVSVGLNYATSRTFPVINEGGKPEYHLIYDMGAGSTTATILKFQGKTVKDIGRFNKTIQEVQALGVGWDTTLGGDAFNTVILEDMLEKFLETKSMKALGMDIEPVKRHGRTMAKLWKEAERMRQVLSANTETSSSFEGLYDDDVNFKYSLSRSTFEKLAAVYVGRARGPITKALQMAKMELGDIESIILHGGAVRTPFIQKELESLTGSVDKIRTNVNSDEAAVFGAAFKAAGISPSFRVKEIVTSDMASFPVTVSWHSEGKMRQQKLFQPNSHAGVEKQVPFKNLEDFTLDLFQQKLNEEGVLQDIPVAKIETQNLTASVKKLTDTLGCIPSEINTKFTIRLSPLNNLPEVLQGTVSCEVTDTGKKGGVVDDVKGFFGFGSKKDDQKPLAEGETADAETSRLDTEATISSTAMQETPSSSPSAGKKSDTSKDEKTKEIKKKIETIYIRLVTTGLGLPQLSPTELKRIEDRMTSFDSSDRSRRLREEALNTLESFTYKARDLLEDEAFIASSTEKERAEIEEKFKSASEWLYGDGADATRDVLKARLKELRGVVDPIQKRKDEKTKIPEEFRRLYDAITQMETMMNIIKDSAAQAAALPSSSESQESQSTATPSPSSVDDFVGLDDEPTITSTSEAATNTPMLPTYSEEDVNELTTLYNSTKAWFDLKTEQQDKLSPTDDPVVSSAEIAVRSNQLNQFVMDLLQRKINKVPKPKTSKTRTAKTKTSKKSKGRKSTSATSEESPVVTPEPSETTETNEVPTGDEPVKPNIKDEL